MVIVTTWNILNIVYLTLAFSTVAPGRLLLLKISGQFMSRQHVVELDHEGIRQHAVECRVQEDEVTRAFAHLRVARTVA
jgi:hypothetical protein